MAKKKFKVVRLPGTYDPIELLQRIKLSKRDPSKLDEEQKAQALKPSELTEAQQNVCIEYLKYQEAYNTTEVANFLELHRTTVARRLKKIDLVYEVNLEKNGFSVTNIATRLARTVEYVKRKARERNNPGLYLKAELEYIEALQRLGLVYEKPAELDIAFIDKLNAEQRGVLIEAIQLIESEGDDSGSDNTESATVYSLEGPEK